MKVIENFFNEKWKFYLPLRVKNELNTPLNTDLQNLIKTGIIKEDASEYSKYLLLKNRFYNLGDGELDAIGIVDKCKDRTFADYIILSDDKIAMKRAESIGMRSIGILPFIVRANNLGFVSKSTAMTFLNTLKKNRFVPTTVAEQLFESSLI